MFPNENGYRGLWYANQLQDDGFRFKYSGGLGTYPQTHLPIAIYSPMAHKTFFCYGGSDANGQALNMVSYFHHQTGFDHQTGLGVPKSRGDDFRFAPAEGATRTQRSHQHLLPEIRRREPLMAKRVGRYS